jgi:flagellum-specific peptidoglycan hydrolase FlgJ
MESGIDSVSAQIMTAQASFESGFFKNSLTEKSNNCFAIHHTSRRFTYSLGKGGEAEGHNLFARFSSLDSAARDFPYFLKYLGVSTRIKDEYQYAYLLKSKNYYGSSADLYARGIVIHRKLLFK